MMMQPGGAIERSRWLGAALLMVVVVFTTTVATMPARAAFPGANGRLVFASDRDGNSEIYSMNPDGSGIRNLTHHAAADYAPVVSADGTRIAFSSDREDGYQLWVMDIDGTDPTRVTDACGAIHPAWSPDGTKLAFTEFCFDDVYVVNADGSGETGLATTDSFEGLPAWSPDGTKIAYARHNGTEYDIWVMDADGSDQVDLTNDPALELHPDWSPDGSKIAFMREDADSGDIFVMDADGSDAVNVTNSPAYEMWPAWSPDGGHIAFAVEDVDVDIWTMASDGSGRTNLTAASNADDNIPDWQPISGPVADLSVTDVDDPDPVAAGSDLTYEIEVANDGPDAAEGVAVAPWVPSGTTFVSIEHPTGWTCAVPAVGGTGAVTCARSSLTAGASAILTLVVKVNETAAEGSTVTSTVSAEARSHDPVLTDNSATASTEVGLSDERCTISGTDDADLLTGTPEDDVICGGSGADSITGGGGDDIIIGGPGRDVLNGEDGNDTLVGWRGRDEITGGNGLDVLVGGGGRDLLDGLDETGGDLLDGGRGLNECQMDEGDLATSCPPPTDVEG